MTRHALSGVICALAVACVGEPAPPPQDGGLLVPVPDAGASSTDAGEAPPDAGEPPTDAGASPTDAGVFFVSDWDTATGSSDQAISSGGAWNNLYCMGRNTTLSVVPGASVGFTRTANVLRLQQLGTTCGMLEAVNAIPSSTSHYGRMYFRNDETTTQHNHVMTYFPVGRIQLSHWNRTGSPQGVRVFMRNYYRADGTDGVYPTARWGILDPLPNGTWFRYEWHMEYVTPTTYRLWPRIYDMAGTLLHDANTYFQSDAGPTSGLTLAAFYAAGNTFGFSNVESARNFGLGNEGPSQGQNSGEYWYHAAVALGTGGWIGP